MKLNIKIFIFGYLDVKRHNVEGKESKKEILKKKVFKKLKLGD